MNIKEEGKVVDVNFNKVEEAETINQEEKREERPITQEMIMGRLEGLIQNHLAGFRELVQDENFKRINEEFELNLVGLTSVLVTQIANQVGTNVEKQGLVSKSQAFIEELAVDYEMHPADVTTMLLKVFSDILFQVIAAEELNQEING